MGGDRGRKRPGEKPPSLGPMEKDRVAKEAPGGRGDAAEGQLPIPGVKLTARPPAQVLPLELIASILPRLQNGWDAGEVACVPAVARPTLLQLGLSRKLSVYPCSGKKERARIQTKEQVP